MLKKILRKLQYGFQYSFKPILHRAKLHRSRTFKGASFDNEQNPYYSQNGQDHFMVEQLFHGKSCGFFVDIGAHDGISGSNSYYLEKIKHWNGVCFEPHPDLFKQLNKVRGCTLVNACVGPLSGEVTFLSVDGPCNVLGGIVDFFTDEHKERLRKCLLENGGEPNEMKVPVVRLTDYCLSEHIEIIDLLCIDVEGAEMDILRSINFDELNIKVICVENNYHGDGPACLLFGYGYELRKMIGCDEIYVKLSKGLVNE